MKPKSTLRSFLALASSTLLAISYSHAGQIWDGGSAGPGDDNWNTAANWDGDVLPTFTNAITFVGNVRNGAVNDLTADSTIGGINLTNDGTAGKTNAFTLSGARITLGGNIVTTASSSAITDSSSLNMILNADRTITTNANHNLSVSGIISQSGTRKLTKDGAGILTLSNANSYSGGTTITAGTVNVTNVGGLGASGSTLSINGASTTRLSTDSAFGGANPVYNMLMFGGGSYTGTIELNRATAVASTAITHNFGLLTISLNGGQPATLNVTAGANAPTGGGGALDTIAFTSMNAGNNNTVTETLNPTGGNITIGALTAAGNSLVTMALSGSTAGNAITGVIGGGTANQQLVAISKIGASTWTLSNAGNNYTGGTTFSGGTLVFANGALGTTGAITGSGGTLRWASGNTQDISSRLAMTAATSTFNTNGNNVTFSSAIGSGVAAALTKTGSGTLTLQGTNTYSGITTVNGGTLSLDYSTGNTNRIATGAALILGGGTLNLSGGGPFTQVVNGTTLTANTGSYVTRTSGSSVLQMGTITPNTGTVNFSADNIATTNNLNNASGILGTWATVGGDWAMNSTDLPNGLITAYAGYVDYTRTDSGTQTIVNDGTKNIRVLDGSGTAANITLAAATTDTNTINQSATGGTVTIDAASKTLRTNAIIMGSTASPLTIGTAAGSGTLTTQAGGTSSITVTNNHSSNLLTINSVIANNGTTSLVKNGTGVLVLTALNTFTGGTTLQDGTIRVGATVGSFNTNGILGGAFNNGLIIANKATAVFDVNGQTAFIKDLKGGGSLGGNVTLGGGTLFLTNPSGTNSYDGTISGAGNVRVTGSSGWNTTGAHTYTGITTLGDGNASITVSILADGGTASGIGQSSSDASNLVFTGTGANTPALRYSGAAAASTNRQFTLGGGGALAVTSTGAITWSSTAAVTYSGTGTRTLAFSGDGTGLGTLAAEVDNISGSTTSLAKFGTSNWTLTNTNSGFTGAITLGTTTTAGGTLSYASAGGANAITFLQTTGSGTLSYTGSGQTMSGLIQANALSTGAITLDASGTGAVNFSNTGSLGVGGASGAKGLVLSGTNTGNNILAGGWANNTLGGAATLTKNGAGTWVLSGTNGYSGPTTVNAGTLTLGNGSALGSSVATVVGGSLDLGGQTTSNTVSVGVAGTLTGSGSAGAATLNGRVTPGGSGSGLITMTAATVGATSSMALQLAATGTRGTNYDAITVSGALALDGTITVSLNGLTPAGGQSFDLIDSTGAIDVTNFTVATDLILPTLSGGLSWDTSAFASTGVISITGGASPYDTWASDKGLTVLNNAKNLDPDNDGRNNLGEFAFNGNPLSGADNGKVYVLTEDSDFDVELTTKELILTVAVRAGTLVFTGSPSPTANQAADGITYTIEGSLDLASFPTTVNVVSPVTTGLPVDPGTGYEYRSFSLNGSNGLSGKGFLRAKVTSP